MPDRPSPPPPRLTPSAAKELGRALEFVRTNRQLTLRDIAQRTGLSAQYVHNITRGGRFTVSDDVYLRVGQAMCLDEDVVRDHILRARVASDLEQRGLSADQVLFIWRGVEQRCAEQGIALQLDLVKIVAGILNGPPCGGDVVSDTLLKPVE